MSLPFLNSPFSRFPSDHPQIELIKSHLVRAMQDLFLISIRNLDDEFMLIFDSEEEIDEFCDGIIKYRESIEEYEVCNEILDTKPQLLEKWEKFNSKPLKKGFDDIKAWLKSTI